MRAAPAIGFDVLIDATAGVRGGLGSGDSTHGLALLHSTWSDREAESDGQFVEFHASVLQTFGHGPTERFVGDLLTVSNSEAYPSLRLYSTWFELHRPQFAWRVGLLLADEEFGFSDVGSNLINASFGWPIYLSANTLNTGPAFFAAGGGTRVRFEPSERSYVQFGVYDGDTFDSATGDPAVNHDGLHYRFGGGQGLFSVLEYGWQADAGLRLKAGAWLHTARFDDVKLDTNGLLQALTGDQPRSHRGNRGAYVVIEKSLRGEPGTPGNIDLHVRGGAAPSDRNAIAWAYDAGLAWYGPWPGRGQDVLAIGFTHARHSSGYIDSAALADPTAPALGFEQVIEINYRIALTERFSLQPDLQYIRNPGASAGVPDAVVALIRAAASF